MRTMAVLSWIALVTVMYGGSSLLRLLARRERPLSDWQLGVFRAGHAHAGVLLLMSLLYYVFVTQTGWAESTQIAWSAVLFAGGLLQSGGFFLHMGFGREGAPSIGTRTTQVGGALLATAVVALVVGLVTA